MRLTDDNRDYRTTGERTYLVGGDEGTGSFVQAGRQDDPMVLKIEKENYDRFG